MTGTIGDLDKTLVVEFEMSEEEAKSRVDANGHGEVTSEGNYRRTLETEGRTITRKTTTDSGKVVEFEFSLTDLIEEMIERDGDAEIVEKRLQTS